MGNVLNELNILLAQSDTAAISLFEENTALLRYALGAAYDKLARQIKNLNSTGRMDIADSAADPDRRNTESLKLIAQ